MKYLVIILCAILFASCSNDDMSELKTDKPDYSAAYENRMQPSMIGEYGTDRIDAEPGAIKITADSLFIKTSMRNVAVKITDYPNSQDMANGLPCWWRIKIGNIQYLFSVKENYTWLKYIDYDTMKEYSVGTYYKDFKEVEQPEINM